MTEKTAGGSRGPVTSVPITVTLEALAQDNGDGTWTVAVPSLTRGTETAPSLATALHRMASALSWGHGSLPPSDPLEGKK